MMKGISSVITVLLLVLVTVVLIGSSFVFFQKVQKNPTKESELILNNVLKTINTQFFVESFADNKIYIRNKGNNLESDEFSFYVDNNLVNFTSDTSSIESGRVGTFILDDINDSSRNLKIIHGSTSVYYPIRQVAATPPTTSTSTTILTTTTSTILPGQTTTIITSITSTSLTTTTLSPVPPTPQNLWEEQVCQSDGKVRVNFHWDPQINTDDFVLQIGATQYIIPGNVDQSGFIPDFTPSSSLTWILTARNAFGESSALKDTTTIYCPPPTTTTLPTSSTTSTSITTTISTTTTTIAITTTTLPAILPTHYFGTYITTGALGFEANLNPAKYNLSYIAGYDLAQQWAKVEPQDDVFNWTYLDNSLQKLKNDKKKAHIRIHAGPSSPDWLRTQKGIKTLCWNQSGGLVNPPFNCFPWMTDPVYQAERKEMLQALYNHYKNERPDLESVISFVLVPPSIHGKTQEFVRVQFPNQTIYLNRNDSTGVPIGIYCVSNIPAFSYCPINEITSLPTSTFTAQGYTDSALYQQFSNSIIDAYQAMPTWYLMVDHGSAAPSPLSLVQNNYNTILNNNMVDKAMIAFTWLGISPGTAEQIIINDVKANFFNASGNVAKIGWEPDLYTNETQYYEYWCNTSAPIKSKYFNSPSNKVPNSDLSTIFQDPDCGIPPTTTTTTTTTLTTTSTTTTSTTTTTISTTTTLPLPTSFRMATGFYTGNGFDNRAITSLGFKPDLVFVKADSASDPMVWTSSAMPSDFSLSLVATGSVSDAIQSLDLDGFTVGTNPSVNTADATYHWIAFQDNNAPDIAVGNYTGNGVDNRIITGLGFQPDLVTIKRNTATGAGFRTSSHTGDSGSVFFGTADETNAIQGFETDGFQIGTSSKVNTAGGNYYYFAFKSSSRFTTGTYTGNGTDNTFITTSFQPDWIWVKQNSTQIGVQRSSSVIGDNASIFGNTSANYLPNIIQSLQPNGFVIGTDTRVNSVGAKYYFVGWKI